MSSSLRKQQVIRATTRSPWTKDFRHLLPVPRHWLKRSSWLDRAAKATRQKDRIKYWNIVPGDQVRLLDDKEGTIHEVLSINRFSNRVFFKGSKNKREGQDMTKPDAISAHYSRCQLFIGNHEFEGSETIKVLPVFATRLGTSSPYWNPPKRRWEWQRFAVNTTPRLPTWSKEDRDRSARVSIPWPEHEPPRIEDPTPYDTLADVVTKVTYVPPPLPSRLLDPVPRPSAATEKAYHRTLLYPHIHAYEPLASAPLELHLVKELSPPHARAKKQKRWQALQAANRRLLHEFVKFEMDRLYKHKSAKEARKWAVFKWRERVAKMRTDELRRRWVNRGGERRLTRKREQRRKKALREDKRLREILLVEAGNQVIPAGMAAPPLRRMKSPVDRTALPKSY